jgi:hypothetical protein
MRRLGVGELSGKGGFDSGGKVGPAHLLDEEGLLFEFQPEI